MLLVPLLAALVGAASEPVYVVRMHGCTCAKSELPLRYADSTLRRILLDGSVEVWFVGKVVRAEPAFQSLESGGPDDSVSATFGGVYAFSVDSAWRGVRTNHVVVYSHGGIGWCQDPVYRLGARYVVAARQRGDSLHLASWCGPKPDPLHADSQTGRWLMRVLGEPNFRRRR